MPNSCALGADGQTDDTGNGHRICSGLIVLSPLQIEFVTGTKKGTTANATATTATASTASTAVAGTAAHPIPALPRGLQIEQGLLGLSGEGLCQAWPCCALLSVSIARLPSHWLPSGVLDLSLPLGPVGWC